MKNAKRGGGRYQNDVPSNYNICIKKKNSSNQRIISNTVIDKIVVDKKLTTTLYVRRAKNIFLLRQFNEKHINLLDSCFTQDTLIFDLCDLLIDHSGLKLIYFSHGESGENKRNEMILPSETQWKSFYDDIWKALNKNNVTLQ